MHDIGNYVHFASLLKGNKCVGRIKTNAMNIRSCRAGPQWVRVINSKQERSIHAEARVALEASFLAHKKNQYKNSKKQKHANGIIVCRFNKSGKLKNSKPCLNCAQIMKRCGIKFVVYSTGKEKGQEWKKESIYSLLFNNNLKQSHTHFRQKQCLTSF